MRYATPEDRHTAPSSNLGDIATGAGRASVACVSHRRWLADPPTLLLLCVL